MQNESWYELVKKMIPASALTIEYLRNEKNRTDIITEANAASRSKRP